MKFCSGGAVISVLSNAMFWAASWTVTWPGGRWAGAPLGGGPLAPGEGAPLGAGGGVALARSICCCSHAA